MSVCLTFTLVVVGELVARPAADLSLTAVRAQRVDAAFARLAVMRAQQTLVDVCGGTQDSVSDLHTRLKVYQWTHTDLHSFFCLPSTCIPPNRHKCH